VEGVTMFKIQQLKRKCRAFIGGEMTIYTAAELKAQLDDILDDPRELELNLGKVSELDSAGVQLLMLAKKERAAKQLVLSLVEHSNAVLEVFETMGLVPYFGDPVILKHS
jgi:anti-sigma B factor antagonist